MSDSTTTIKGWPTFLIVQHNTSKPNKMPGRTRRYRCRIMVAVAHHLSHTRTTPGITPTLLMQIVYPGGGGGALRYRGGGGGGGGWLTRVTYFAEEGV